MASESIKINKTMSGSHVAKDSKGNKGFGKTPETATQALKMAQDKKK
ncbi:hypothetical protein [Lyngbya sp. PCC 8106]|nr:hypothetical protein [Lyngbya sp. PCC 8106]EAW36682.1 hypothetical protein L8106_29560 [Lyngbya sp. PCC 8106]